MENVSFIIPNYNAKNTIGKAIESIQNQKYNGEVEIIVVDDKSKDNSVRTISKYKNIKLIKNKKNIGLARSLNKAIKISKYKLLCIIWCDCVLADNNWLNEIVKTYNSSKKIGVVASKLVIPKNYWNKFDFWSKVVLVKDYEVSLKDEQKEGRPTLFNKKLLLKVGLYDYKTFRIAGEDTDLMWKIKERKYKIKTAKVSLLHLHGFYNLSLKKQLFDKALPLAEASGVNFARYGEKSFSSKYWNPITSTFLYLALFVPVFDIIAIILILILIGKYTFSVYKHVKDVRIILVPFFKFFKDIITIFGFWKGFFSGKQKF
ncbi:hypothetical protein CL617_03650 [archaeon]|nr:hypothetical protein [archaeon]|tara:strand:- start:812 stop:1762 length:951 start_codon:yes stop_codon:yes gene_type:complete